MIGSETGHQHIQNRRHLTTCFGCSRPIRDEYSLRVADYQWHSECLRCKECGKSLEEERTCFLLDNGLYCRHDLFRCPGCSLSFDLSDLVVQVRPRTIYHSSCFRCIRCHRHLSSRCHTHRHSAPTDFALLPEGPLCREDFLLAAVEGRLWTGSRPTTWPRDRRDEGKHVQEDTQLMQDNSRSRCNTPTSDEFSDERSNSDDCKSLTDHFTDLAYVAPVSKGAPHQGLSDSASASGLAAPIEEGDQGRRGTRVRTVMNEAQLGVLRAFYGRNSRPDSTTKDRLSAITGLSTKVIRVWFQNKRCKDKKKTKTKA